MIDETVRSDYRGGYVHRALLPCVMCRGTGLVQGSNCAACLGAKKFEAGCGGSAEVDEHYGAAYCLNGCNAIPREEVSDART